MDQFSVCIVIMTLTFSTAVLPDWVTEVLLNILQHILGEAMLFVDG